MNWLASDPRIVLDGEETGAMPIHDWSRVDAGVFHAFRQRWIVALCDALNAEVLPEDHFALIEEAAGVPVVNILAGPAIVGAGRGGRLRAPRSRAGPVRRIASRSVTRTAGSSPSSRSSRPRIRRASPRCGPLSR